MLDASVLRGRYKAILVSQDEYPLQLSRYIHRKLSKLFTFSAVACQAFEHPKLTQDAQATSLTNTDLRQIFFIYCQIRLFIELY
jgi:hypothetical protein